MESRFANSFEFNLNAQLLSQNLCTSQLAPPTSTPLSYVFMPSRHHILLIRLGLIMVLVAGWRRVFSGCYRDKCLPCFSYQSISESQHPSGSEMVLLFLCTSPPPKLPPRISSESFLAVWLHHLLLRLWWLPSFLCTPLIMSVLHSNNGDGGGGALRDI